LRQIALTWVSSLLGSQCLFQRLIVTTFRTTWINPPLAEMDSTNSLDTMLCSNSIYNCSVLLLHANDSEFEGWNDGCW